MDLNTRSNSELLQAQPRHSTVSAYIRKSNRRSEDVELTTVEEYGEQKKTLIGAIRELKNEVVIKVVNNSFLVKSLCLQGRELPTRQTMLPGDR
jgi:hypothetical protein